MNEFKIRPTTITNSESNFWNMIKGTRAVNIIISKYIQEYKSEPTISDVIKIYKELPECKRDVFIPPIIEKQIRISVEENSELRRSIFNLRNEFQDLILINAKLEEENKKLKNKINILNNRLKS